MRRLVLISLAVLCLAATVVRGPGTGVGVSGGGRFGAPGVAGPAPFAGSFEFDPSDAADDAGTAGLTASLTINSLSEDPVFRYIGSDCDATDCDADGFGIALTRQVVATIPDFDVLSPFMGTKDQAVGFKASDFYEAGNNTLGNLATNDAVWEFVFRPSGNAGTVMAKRDDSTTNGWQVRVNASDKLELILEGTTSVTLTSTGSVLPSHWYHVMGFYNESEAGANGGHWVINGVADANTTMNPGDLDEVTPLTMGARDDTGADAGDPLLLYFALYSRATWFADSDLASLLTVARGRMYDVAGVNADVGLESTVPTSFTFTSVSTIEIRSEADVSTLFKMGTHWPRVQRVDDSAGTEIVGYISEDREISRLLRSEEFDITWTTVTSTITADQAIAPDGTMTADLLSEDSTNAPHYVQQGETTTLGFQDTLSVFAKKVNLDFMYIENESQPNYVQFFDLTDCSVGTNSGSDAVDWAQAEDWGNGWCRLSVTATNTNASGRLKRFGCSTTDGLRDYLGTSTDAIYLWGANFVDKGHGLSTYMHTNGAFLIRQQAVLEFDGLANIGGVGSNGTGAASVQYLPTGRRIRSVNGTQTHLPTFLSLHKTAGADRIELQAQNSLDPSMRVLINETAVDQADVAGTTDIADNIIHIGHMRWASSLVELFIDTVSEGTPDVSATIPTALNEITVGGGYFGNTLESSPHSTISRIRIWPAAQDPE